MNSQELASILAKPHGAVRTRITNHLKALPMLLSDAFQKRAFINAQGKAEIIYDITDRGLEYICGRFGRDGLQLATVLQAKAEVGE